MTPAQVLEQRRRLIIDQDVEGFIALFAPNGVMEMPFGGSGLPDRVEGQAAIAELSRRAADGLRFDDFENVVVHETGDPEVVVAETVTRATHLKSGKPFVAPSIQVFRIRDGKILLFRAYTGPATGV
ncbi:MAG TPA: nuclear transport factor 2 family protein [Streptosporangiaceae bacterium]|nr:nuclear transport factor 2 family protein [Streptosporangiaceae bacterium]